MKNTLKKAIASVMTVASLATCITGMNASAATSGYGYVRKSDNTIIGDSSLTVASDFVYAATTSRIGYCDVITVKITSTYGATIYGNTEHSEYDEDSVSIYCSVSGVTRASSYHSISKGNISGNGSLTVYNWLFTNKWCHLSWHDLLVLIFYLANNLIFFSLFGWLIAEC